MSTSASSAEKLLAGFLDNPPIAIISVVAALVIAAIFLAVSGGQPEAVVASSGGSQPKMSKAKAQKKANQAAKKKAAAQKEAASAARAEALAQVEDSDDEDSPSTATKVKKKRRKRSKKKKMPAAAVAAAEGARRANACAPRTATPLARACATVPYGDAARPALSPPLAGRGGDPLHDLIPHSRRFAPPLASRPARRPALRAADIIADQGDEWSTIPKKVKTKSKKKSHKPTGGSSTPAADQEKKEIAVPSRKIGTIIGKAGTTIHAIKDAAGVEIDIQDRESTSGDTTIVTITGDAEGVKFAVKIINETIKNNYCKLMKGESFKEGSMSVPACFHATIIGPKGATIKKLKDIGNGVEISMPDKATGGERVKLGGDSADIAQCKAAIEDLMKYTHSSIIDPAKIHVEIEIAESKVRVYYGRTDGHFGRCCGAHGDPLCLSRSLLLSLALFLYALLSLVRAARVRIYTYVCSRTAPHIATAARTRHRHEGGERTAHPGHHRRYGADPGPPPRAVHEQERYSRRLGGAGPRGDEDD